MFKILLSTLILTVLSLAEAPLLKTGQTTSYAEFDDGHYGKGAVREYDDQKISGVVIDKATNLQWQNDYSDNGDAIKSADWQGAIDYCAGLELAGDDNWRLPTRKELVSLSDYGRTSPAINPKFTQVASTYYWSSTTYAGGTSGAWRVYFRNGRQYYNSKSYSHYVRCVRSGQL